MRIFICSLLFLLLTNCAENKVANTDQSFKFFQAWLVDFPKNEAWKTGFSAKNDRAYIIELTPANESVHSWTQIVTYQYHIDNNIQNKSDFNHFVDNELASPVRNCSSVRTRMIKRSDTSVVFEWSDDGCNGYAAEHTVSRYEYNNKGILNLRYAQIPKQTSASFPDWIQRVVNATIVDYKENL